MSEPEGVLIGFEWVKNYTHPGHPLHGRPLTRRASGLLEAECEHGTGHPIPESVKWMESISADESRGTWGIHGCDGCCGPSK